MFDSFRFHSLSPKACGREDGEWSEEQISNLPLNSSDVTEMAPGRAGWFPAQLLSGTSSILQRAALLLCSSAQSSAWGSHGCPQAWHRPEDPKHPAGPPAFIVRDTEGPTVPQYSPIPVE